MNRPLEFSSDDDFLNYIQEAHFNYMWDGAQANSGLAAERIHLDGDYPQDDAHIVTTGGSGFGIAGLIVGVERGFISRAEFTTRMNKIVTFLESADKFHGVWPHWIDGTTGKVKAFSTMDDGGDLVESAFLMQGLICVREYLKDGSDTEKAIAERINDLWEGMEWSWYQNGQDKLFWHWSPNYDWQMNFALEGYNECLITYILGASSPTYPITVEAYDACWARGGDIVSNKVAYDMPLILSHNYNEDMGGPLFWAHYSYIGLCPQGLVDKYASYWDVNVNHTLIDYTYCVNNPKGYKGYGEDCWGLTASYSPNGYSAHSPANDLGVITPTAALSSFPYSPEQSMAALKNFYFNLGDDIWGEYGFYDAFSLNEDWCLPRYLAIDQCTIAPMIENYRSGLLWKLFMGAPEIQEGLTRLGFTYPEQ